VPRIFLDLVSNTNTHALCIVLVALAGLTARSPDTRRYYLNVISQLTQVLRVLRRRL
jgi:hypothetical protein